MDACSFGLSKEKHQIIYKHTISQCDEWKRSLIEVIAILQPLVAGINVLQGDSPNMAAVYPLCVTCVVIGIHVYTLQICLKNDHLYS